MATNWELNEYRDSVKNLLVRVEISQRRQLILMLSLVLVVLGNFLINIMR
jgi:hypothetical protein